MENLNINMDNINKHLANAILPHIERNAEKITLSNTDINYVEELVKRGKFKEAKNIMSNLKTVARIINDQITEVDCFLKSMEV